MLKIKKLIENKNKIKNIISKHENTLKKNIEKMSFIRNFYGFSIFTTLILSTLLLYKTINNFELLPYFLLCAMFFSFDYLYHIKENLELNKMDIKESSFSSFIILRLFFKKKEKSFLEQKIYEHKNMYTKESKKSVDDFLHSLNNEELNIYNELIENKMHYNNGLFFSYEQIVFKYVLDFLSNSEKNEIIKNKEIIFNAIDQLEETSINSEKLISLYIRKTSIKGAYKNKQLNQIDQIEDINIKNKNIVKQI